MAALVRSLIAVVAIAGALLAHPVIAAEPASVTEIECGIILPGILPEGQVLSTTGQLTITPGGTATLFCAGQLAEPTGAFAMFTDIDCALGNGGQVAESLVIVRPSGLVTLVCQNNPGSEPFIPDPDD
jgi:hypothetical protein